MKLTTLLGMMLVAGGLVGCAGLIETRLLPPTLDQLVERARAGDKPQSIIETMRETSALYRISGSELARLRERGLPDPVLDEILRGQLEAARYEEWRRSRDAAWVYGPRFAPLGRFVPYSAN